MTKKLLDKTLSVYMLFSVLLLVVSAPLFYYFTERLYVAETDETLMLHKNEFIKYTLPTLRSQEISDWNKYNRNEKIETFKNSKNDTLFYKSYYDSLDAEIEPYRELNSAIFINGKYFTYSVRINLVEAEDIMESIAVLFLVIISLLLIGLFLITKRLSLKLWQPFYETLIQIEQFEVNKTIQPKFKNTAIEEFNRLGQSVEKLIEKNTSIFHIQREFIENAAHELQTPLAIFQAKIDTFIQSSKFTEEQYKMLSSLNESVARLKRLNKNLLLLSKLENDSYNEKETICLNELIEKNLDFFTEQASAKNLTIKLNLSEKVKVESNPVLAEILISNLFINAIRHNVTNGQLLIELNNHSVKFSNSGQFQPLNSKNLFNRFSKMNPSDQGNGLGLAIVKKITKNNNWKINYSYATNLHCFSVNF